MEPEASRIPVPVQIAIGVCAGLYAGYAVTEIKNSKCLVNKSIVEKTVLKEYPENNPKVPFSFCTQVNNWPIH